jgi:hypothetical protein
MQLQLQFECIEWRRRGSVELSVERPPSQRHRPACWDSGKHRKFFEREHHKPAGVLDSLSASTKPRLVVLAGAVDSLNATIAGQQATLASVRPTQVVSISPSDLSLCTGGWTTESFPSFSLRLCRKVANSGCGSILVAVPAGTVYDTRASRGWVTLYQKGPPDAFGVSFPTLGDSLTIWSGSTLLWDYAVGIFRSGNPHSCPANGGAQPPASLNGFWSCATGTDIFSTTAFFSMPLFGPS